MNDTLIHADIFFFITTIAVVVIVLVLLVAGFYIFKVMRTVSRIADRVEEESEKVAGDISDLRERIKEEGAKVSGIGKWVTTFALGKIFASKAKSARKAKSHSRDSVEDSE